MKKKLLAGILTVLASVSLCMIGSSSATTFKVDVYSGFSNTATDGSPYSNYYGSYTQDWTQRSDGYWGALPTGLQNDMNFHPFGLGDFGAVLTGYFSAPQDGVYSLWTFSDDGSRMFVDGKLAVDNGGPHGPNWAWQQYYYITAGVHEMTINFYEDFGGESLLEGWLVPSLTPVNAPVPEPASILLFGIGIAGFVGTRLRSKKK